MIEVQHPVLSVTRQCRLLGLPRASYYHRPRPEPKETLRLIDETYLAYPFFGLRQMARWRRRQGECINRKRVPRLMRRMTSTLGRERSSGAAMTGALGR